MATKSAILAVKIVSDAKEFSRGTDQAVGDLGRFESKAMSIGKSIAGAFAIGAVVAFGKQAVDSALDASKAGFVFTQTFGDMKKQSEDFYQTTARGWGLTKSEFDKAAAAEGRYHKNLGKSSEQAFADTSKAMQGYADIAASSGRTVSDVAEMASAARRGEYDSLQNIIPEISAATIERRLEEKGLGNLTGAEKALATAQEAELIIAEKAATVRGAAAAYADTEAGKLEILKNDYENLSATLGSKLLPVFQGFVDILTKVVDWVSQNIELVTIFAATFGLLAAALIVMAFPFITLAVLVAGLVAGLVYLATQTTFFGDVWNAVCQFAAASWNAFVGFITAVWNGFVGFLGDTFNNIRGAFDAVITWIRDAWNGLWSGAAGLVQGAVGAITGYIDGIVGSVRNAIGWVERLFSGFSVPGWMRDVMNFMGVGGAGFEYAAGGPSLAGLGADMGAVGSGGMSGLFGASTGGSTTVNNYTINIDGALDTDGVARQIETLLRRQSRNTGSAPAAGGF